MQDLLEYIIKNLVSHPEEVGIEETIDNTTINLNLTINPQDMGIVIGRGGQTIRALRRLLVTRALSEDIHRAVRLNLQEVKQ